MNLTFLISALLASLSLVACDRATVVSVLTPVPVPAAVPGPAGPAGAKGATGKTGGGGVVIVVPPAPEPAK